MTLWFAGPMPEQRKGLRRSTVVTLLGIAMALGGAAGFLMSATSEDEWMAGSFFGVATIGAGVGLFVAGVLSLAGALQRNEGS